MAQALLRSQKEGKLGAIKLRLVQCTLDEQAAEALDQLDQVPPPPLPDSSPGEDYDAGGIPIRINDEWYRLGSYQARFAAADMVSQATPPRYILLPCLGHGCLDHRQSRVRPLSHTARRSQFLRSVFEL